MRSIDRAEARTIRLGRPAPSGTLGEEIVARARVAVALHMAQSARLVRDQACVPRMARCAVVKEVRP